MTAFVRVRAETKPNCTGVERIWLFAWEQQRCRMFDHVRKRDPLGRRFDSGETFYTMSEKDTPDF